MFIDDLAALSMGVLQDLLKCDNPSIQLDAVRYAMVLIEADDRWRHPTCASLAAKLAAVDRKLERKPRKPAVPTWAGLPLTDYVTSSLES